ncbi:MAG: class I SAM-dependent methyltransferase [Micromonosporaceae bacterium]|nr:class I SAM-dependent methyltransferase [Micromonosporaceae bacterium]
MGRWSRLVASQFLGWLAPSSRLRWLDVGCGTGALAAAIASTVDPLRLAAVDPSVGFAATARADATLAGALVGVADGQRLPFAAGSFDLTAAGLVVNFAADPAALLAEMVRVTVPGGTVAGYVWDYAGRMRMLRMFWEVAAQLRPDDSWADEGRRFPLCRPEPLRELWGAAGLTGVEAEPVDMTMEYRDFDDYWLPFLGGQGPAGEYVASLPERRRIALREVLRARLPGGPDGSIRLSGRVWAVRGRR